MAWWVYLLGVPMGILFCGMGVATAFLLGVQLRSSGALGLLALIVAGIVGFFGFGLWMIAGMLRSKVVLTADAVAVQGIFRVRRLARTDIAGWRLLSLQYGQKALVLSPKDPRAPTLKIASSMRTDSVWDAWVAALPDLDQQEARALEAEVAANAELGQTPEQRLARLAATRKLVNLLNYATYAVAAWGYVYPRPYELALLVLGVLPWIAIVLVAKSSGLLRIDTRRGDPRPGLGVPVIVPGLVLLLRAVLDVEVLEVERALMFAAGTAAVLTWAAVMSDAGMRAKPAGALLLALLACGYGYGVVVLVNWRLDSATGENYRVAVLARHVSSGRHTSYHILLEPWGPRTEPADVTVSRDLYTVAAPGSSVCVHRGPGALGISWYDVAGCGG